MCEKNKKHYKHFFFDFDGMLCDSYPHIVGTFIKAMKKLRNVDIDYEEAFSKFKISFAVAYVFYKITPEEDAFYATYHKDIHMEPLAQLYAGVREFLQENITRGNQNYIYTNRGETLYGYLELFDIEHLFTDIIISAQKPDPALLEAMLDKHSLDRRQCVVVGDRVLDIEGARNAGVDGILFDEFYNLADVDATYVIHEIKELFDFL